MHAQNLTRLPTDDPSSFSGGMTKLTITRATTPMPPSYTACVPVQKLGLQSIRPCSAWQTAGRIALVFLCLGAQKSIRKIHTHTHALSLSLSLSLSLFLSLSLSLSHVSRSSGLAKTILQGTVKGGRRQGGQRKKWEDNIREWTGLEFGKSQGAVENRENGENWLQNHLWCPNDPRG